MFVSKKAVHVVAAPQLGSTYPSVLPLDIKLQTSDWRSRMFITILQQAFVTIVLVVRPLLRTPPHPLIWRRVGGIAAGAGAVAAAV